MNTQNDHDTYIIPPNFVDTGTFFGGMFRARNVIEAGILAAVTGLPVFLFLPFMPHFRECVVCISHVYDHELPDWCLLDYDNLQQKQILDTIALYVMADDSGFYVTPTIPRSLGIRTAPVSISWRKAALQDGSPDGKRS